MRFRGNFGSRDYQSQQIACKRLMHVKFYWALYWIVFRCTKLHIFLHGEHMSFEHQKVIAASTAALMSISSSVPEIQLQPAILKQYAV